MKIYLFIAAVLLAFVAVIVLRPNNHQLGSLNQLTPLQQLNSLVGKPAPDFSLTDQTGHRFVLSQQRGRAVVLFFSEGIMCYPACWNQMAALGAEPQFHSNKVVSASIVPDNATDWTAAIKKMPALGKGTILLDTTTSVSSTYNMLNLPSSMHRGAKPGHTYIVIDQTGIVRDVLDDPNMGIQNSALLADLAKL